MRARSHLWFVAATAILALVVLTLTVGAARAAAGLTADDWTAARLGPRLWTTLAWAVAVAGASCIAGWWPARLLAGLLNRRGFLPVAALCFIPICLPPYLMYWCWWQAWPQGSWIHEWLVAHRIVEAARAATLVLSLTFWAWPIAAWCVAGSLAFASQSLEEMQALDGAPLLSRTLLRIRQSARGLVIGFTVILLTTFNETTAFDLATVRTLGYEIRAAAASGASRGAVNIMAAPGTVLAAVCIACILLLVRRRPDRSTLVPLRFEPRALAATIPIWLISIAFPVGLAVFGQRFRAADFDLVVTAYSRAAFNSMLAAAVAGVACACIAAGLATAWSSGQKPMRRMATFEAAVWAFLAALPAVQVALLIEAALNMPLLVGVYRTAAAILTGYVARFGLVAVLLGVWIAAQESQEGRHVRLLDGAVSLRAQMRAGGPRWLAGLTACFLIVGTLSMGEVVVTAHLQPPGFDAIAAILLSNIHYQRDALVALMAMILFAMAAIAATATGIAFGIGGGFRRRPGT